MGLSIVGGTDQACPPFGMEQRGVFVSKVRKEFSGKKNIFFVWNRFSPMVQHLERIYVLVIEY